jgi:hypothetical protein
MNNPFIGGSNRPDYHWRELRSNLTADLTDAQHLQAVVQFWSMAPLIRPFLDWDNPDKWPDPWELLSEANYDPSAVALGMEYTLLLSEDKRWSPSRMHLSLACTADKSTQKLILMVDDCHVLNYAHGQILPLEKVAQELVIQQDYRYINKVHTLQYRKLSYVEIG